MGEVAVSKPTCIINNATEVGCKISSSPLSHFQLQRDPVRYPFPAGWTERISKNSAHKVRCTQKLQRLFLYHSATLSILLIFMLWDSPHLYRNLEPSCRNPSLMLGTWAWFKRKNVWCSMAHFHRCLHASRVVCINEYRDSQFCNREQRQSIIIRIGSCIFTPHSQSGTNM